MFPPARNNSLRRWSEHGNKIPIPIAVTLHNVMTTTTTLEGENTSTATTNKKWFRPQHDTSLLPTIQLEIVLVVQGEDQNNDASQVVVYSSGSSTTKQSVHPSWEHLDERIDLPEEWWLGDVYYPYLKLRFTRLLNNSNDTDDDTETDTDTENSSLLFLEVPLYPAKLERLPQGVPDALPPNACLVHFSDGSTRLPKDLFELLLERHIVTEAPPMEDFSRFEEDAFKMLDSVPQTPTTLNTKGGRERSASLLDEEELSNHNNKSVVTTLFPEPKEVEPLPFEQSEQDARREDIQTERELLEALIAQEEAEMEQDLLALEEVRYSARTSGMLCRTAGEFSMSYKKMNTHIHRKRNR
jgi:hypothetical protein